MGGDGGRHMEAKDRWREWEVAEVEKMEMQLEVEGSIDIRGSRKLMKRGQSRRKAVCTYVLMYTIFISTSSYTICISISFDRCH